jgi:hypothetical protein
VTWSRSTFWSWIQTQGLNWILIHTDPETTFMTDQTFSKFYTPTGIDGQDRFVSSQTDNFRLFLYSTNGQTTNFRLHNELTVNVLKKIAWAPFDVSMYVSQCLYLHVFMSPISISSCLYVHVSNSVSLCSVSVFPCLHAYIPPCLHISPCFRKRKQELTENGNFRLFSASEKRKCKTSVCLLPRKS